MICLCTSSEKRILSVTAARLHEMTTHTVVRGDSKSQGSYVAYSNTEHFCSFNASHHRIWMKGYHIDIAIHCSRLI